VRIPVYLTCWHLLLLRLCVRAFDVNAVMTGDCILKYLYPLLFRRLWLDMFSWEVTQGAWHRRPFRFGCA